MSKFQSLSMRGWFSQPTEEPTSLSRNVLLDHEIPIQIQSPRTFISHILIWKALGSIKKLLKPMKISGKGTKQLLKNMRINGSSTPHLENAAHLCASYARIIPRSLNWLLSWPLQLWCGMKVLIRGASLAPSVFGLLVKTANTEKTYGIKWQLNPNMTLPPRAS